MTIALHTAVTGAEAQQTRINIIAGNVAAVNVDGYKKQEASFADIFYTNLKKAGIIENSEASPRPIGAQIGMGVKLVGTYRNLAQGPLNQTFRALDMAIAGGGYFAITLPNGRVGYTRAGNFQKDAQTGNIVTSKGNPLTNGIAIPEGINVEDIQISDNGLITAQDPDNPVGLIEIGQVELFTFPNESGLEAIGDNLLVETVGSGEAVNIDDLTGRIKQRFLEGSNVQAVEELTKLIEAQRAYELNTRVISTQDKIMETANKI
ncbi:MAG: flagellar basal-body rod protein FlgG [Rickettsiales bacterium]|nr:MAG: flagellar basal-body rod protein FlgG [Rickettsiales bacterium]